MSAARGSGEPLEAPVLHGALVRLEPLTRDHAADLARAAAEDRGTYGYTYVPDGDEDAAAYVTERTTAPDAMAFAQVRVADDSAVGSTSFLSMRRRPDDGRLYAVEIGATFLAASAQGTGINREAKLLLLTHAFEVWHVGRVDLKTDARNARARRAIEGIGARFEGVLRNWQPSLARGERGLLRDSAMFSIVASEWPAVGDRLRRDVTG
ncbi:MAG: GNAT family protein [Acidimicrobiales bacterium]